MQRARRRARHNYTKYKKCPGILPLLRRICFFFSFYKQHFYKKHQADIGKTLSKS